ncbi:MAG: DUF2088 domain-containing protein, partial [Spirochaetia bacterium]|nr:DUF2088 domain-containing protein [Spirochaetia bacterium]
MQLSIPYRDQQQLNIEISDAYLSGVLEPNEVPSLGEREALSSSVGTLAGFLKGAESVLVIINDATRPTPTLAMLDVILPCIEESGLSDAQLTILVATRAHRQAKEDE